MKSGKFIKKWGIEMKISACYIVKNEEAVLKRSFKSLIDAVDEILVLDTGSTDRTLDIVGHYPKVKLYQAEWQEDFAAARNAVLEKAQGDWVVFLDADEFFSSETAGHLRTLLKNLQNQEVLLVRMKNIEMMTGEVLAEFWAPRIFRAIPELRYTGRIHEQLRRSDGTLPKTRIIPAEQLLLLHTGYSAEQSVNKARRNFQMLQAVLAQTEKPDELYRYLAEACYGLGELAEAEHYARMDIAGGRRPITYASRSYRILLQILTERKDYAARKEFAGKAAAEFPELPEFQAELAECFAYEFAYEQAIRTMQQALCCKIEENMLELSQFDEESRHMAQKRLQLWQQIQKREKTLRISACLIAKNEAKDLPRWLQNAFVYCDEAILVDTGSTDATVRIAEASGANVYTYDWQDDFASAKNFALEQAQGEWIAFLDADEYFAEPEKVRGFLAWLDCTQPETDAAMVMLSNIDEDDHNQEIQRFTAVRLFRNSPALRYRGRVHEAVYRNQGELQLWIESQRLLIYHTGYSSRRIQAKLERNMALLQADIAQHGEQPGQYRYLADCYFGMKDYEKTLHYALLAIDAKVISMGSQGDLYHLAIESMRQLQWPAEKMLPFVQQAVEVFSELPDYYAERGMILSSLGQCQEAVKDLEHAICIFEGKDGRVSHEASYFKGAADIAYRRLAEIYYKEGKSNQAEQCFAKALRLNPYRKGSLQMYRGWHAKETAASFVARIRGFYAEGRDGLDYLSQWAARSEEAELFLYFDQCLRAECAAGSLLRSFFAARQAGEPAKLYSLAVAGIAERMCKLFSLLIYWQESIQKNENFLLERAVAVLPESLQRLFLAYTGQDVTLQQKDLDGYFTLLPIVARENNAVQLQRYIALLRKYFPSALRQTADKLFELEKWEQAGQLYEEMRMDIVADPADFWCRYGICCYQRHDNKQAMYCLDKAQNLGCRRKDLAAYRKWSEEGLSDG